MGIFDGIKSLKAVNDIRNGNIASLSYGMLVNGLINLQDAQRKLSKEQFSRVYALYKDFKKCTTPIKMDQYSYIYHCKEIIGKFDEIAPYELYSGGNELEFSLMMDDLRKEKQTGVDTCSIDEDYVGMIIDESNKNNQASNIKNAELKSTTSNYDKLYSELSFYKQLVEEGLIDEDDYNSVKKKL